MIDYQLSYQPLQDIHIEKLASALRCTEVYKHIEPSVPSAEDFALSHTRAIAAQSESSVNQKWLNYVVTQSSTNEVIGRLEATTHDTIAEVAFLFNPKYWGKGYASRSICWLHEEVKRLTGIENFWATTTPENRRCQALLLRNGYKPVANRHPTLLTYEHGDLVFNFSSAA